MPSPYPQVSLDDKSFIQSDMTLAATSPSTKSVVDEKAYSINDIASESTQTAEDDYPDGGIRAWLVVFGVTCGAFATFGYLNAWGVFQAYYEENMMKDVSSSSVAWIGSIQNALVFAPGLITGRMFDKGYLKLPMAIASAVLIVATLLTAECTKYWHFLLCQGFATGIASGVVFGPMIGVLAHWFKKRKSVAFALASSGSAIGGITFPIVSRNLIPHVGFAWTMRILAFVQLGALMVSNLTIARRLPIKPTATSLVDFRAFKEPAYAVYCGAGFLGFLGFTTLITYIDISAVSVGVPSHFAFYLVSCVNAGSAVGRVIGGIIADKIGAVNVIAPMSLIAVATTLGWPFARTEGEFVAVAIIFGLSWGNFSSLIFAPVVELSNVGDVGTRLGMFMTVLACGSVLGPPISGAINEKTGTYVPVAIFAGCVIAGSICSFLAVRFMVLRRWRGKF
ncbi:major facilitator superfamily domain-containing protein [Cristinia sonorae]|uniref:Major facilitator superfamily domain-containing protein n=1 Tax=Cristinia sonorae TaxID=1940300 RepID=A0A8K0UY76_9AGAR|nr:major facilitator superfamily domain-containing protein [Cristinia sonorae]